MIANERSGGMKQIERVAELNVLRQYQYKWEEETLLKRCVPTLVQSSLLMLNAEHTSFISSLVRSGLEQGMSEISRTAMNMHFTINPKRSTRHEE